MFERVCILSLGGSRPEKMPDTEIKVQITQNTLSYIYGTHFHQSEEKSMVSKKYGIFFKLVIGMLKWFRNPYNIYK